MDLAFMALGFALVLDLLLTIIANQGIIMANRDELLTGIAELKKNAEDTTAAVTAVAASIGGLKADLEAVRALLGDAEVNEAAIAEALSRVTGLVDTTQANEDALLALLPAVEPPVTE